MRIKRALTVSSLVIAGLMIIGLARTIPRTVTGSGMCAACHAGRQAYESWRASPHAKTPCLACHGEPGLGGLVSDRLRAVRNGLLTVVGSGAAATVVSNDACTACHTRIVDDLIVRKGVRIDHEAPQLAGWRCSDCHGSVGHQLRSKSKAAEPTYDKCFSCHRVGGGAEHKCRYCHIAPIKPGRSPGKSAGSLNHGRDWRNGHGQADLLTCRNCHAARFCRRCHSAALPHPSAWITAHARSDEAVTTACIDCHRRAFCRDCHGVAMPHPRPYYPRHAGDAARRADICRRCHDAADCTKCHTSHVNHPIVK